MCITGWCSNVLLLKFPHEERYGRALITTRDFQWSWQGQHLVLGLDEAGDGAIVLLLPALSSISTRGEMHPLMERLASQFRVVAIDWPGFGTRSRPNVRWTPDALSTFLEHILEQVVGRPHGIVAAGHAASYVLDRASRRSGITDRLVLIAPTGPCQRWRAACVRSLPNRTPLSRPLPTRSSRRITGPHRS